MFHKKQKSTSVAQAVGPFRLFAQRMSIFILILASLVVIVIGKTSPVSTQKIRTILIDTASPFLSVLSSPVQSYQQLKESVRDFFIVHEQNALLKQENESLRKLKEVTVELEAENKRLREMVKFLPPTDVKFVTARVVGDTGGTYNRSVIISTSDTSGLREGQVVTNNLGLVGRITEVGKKSARVMLITDLSSRVPVISEHSGERAVMAGNNNDFTFLMYLPPDTKMTTGERVLTSGDGEYFPAGIPVGIVQSVSNKSVTIIPFVDWSRLNYVTITDQQTDNN